MRWYFLVPLGLLLSPLLAEEDQGWSWDAKHETQTEDGILVYDEEDTQPAATIIDQQQFNANNTNVDKIVETILSSARQGRNLPGFDDIYSDPNVQEAVQKDDETEAKNVIRERLCGLGLMQCESGEVQEKRPYIAPEDLVYAQPVDIKPVGRPIPSIPVRNPNKLNYYGPPKPVPYPGSHGPPGPHGSGPQGPFGPGSQGPFGPGPQGSFGPGPQGSFGPGPQGSFGPPGKYGPHYKPLPPPRREYGPGKPYYPGPSPKPFATHPPSSFEGDFLPSKADRPYDFDHGTLASTQKEFYDKKTVVANGVQQHVHHHFHHATGDQDVKVPSIAPVVTNLGSQFAETQTGFISSNYGGGHTKPVFESVEKPLTIGGIGGAYGGQTIASYGGVGTGLGNFGSKPSPEFNGLYGPNTFGTSVGSYGSSSFFKKELNLGLNSINGNSLQGYQSIESPRNENFDCICVPYDQCPSADIIGRKDDLYLAIDPRNIKSDIEALTEERVITDGNGTMTVIRVAKEANETSGNEEKKVAKRETTSNQTEPQGRQAYYQGERPQACGPRHVCCKRPLRPQVPNPGLGPLKQCGTRHSQGINGRIKNPSYVDGDSEFGEYPWQVAILKKDPKESVYVCGGTLIDHLHIITAAHCVKTYGGFDLRVRLGEWDVNHDVEFYPYIERDIVAVEVHPEFYAGTLYNDLAILRMDKPVDWTKYPHISPACLPAPHDDYTGQRCWTTGWGKDAFGDFGKYQNILKEVDVPVVNFGQCQRVLQQTRLGYEFKLHPGFLCAGGEEGKDACKGDGGGPMVCERGGTWQIVGVVSWGIGCGQPGLPGVYVRVSHYLDWIHQVTQRY